MSGNVRSIQSKVRKHDPDLILNLARGLSHVKVAELSGVSERTIARRLAEPDFRRAVDDARAELMSQALGVLVATSSSAALTLEQLLKSDSDHVRHNAARSILELGMQLRKADEFDRRLAALEAATATHERRDAA